jgi:hypothetical protein
MMKRYLRAGLLVVALSSLALPFHAHAELPGQILKVRSLFEAARHDMEAGNYAAAVPRLEEALHLDPQGSGIKFNLAECYEHVGRLASAWALYLDVANAERLANQVEREKLARERATAIAPRVPRLAVVVHSTDSGIAVMRDGEALASALWGTAVAVDPGPHSVSASAPGKVAWSHAASLGEGEEVTVIVPQLEPTPVIATGAVAANAETKDALGARRMLALVGAGAGLAALGTGAGFGLASNSEYAASNRDGHCNQSTNICDARGRALRDDSLTHGDLSTAFFIGGAALAVVSGVLWLTAPRSPVRGAKNPAGVVPIFTARSAGIEAVVGW